MKKKKNSNFCKLRSFANNILNVILFIICFLLYNLFLKKRINNCLFIIQEIYRVKIQGKGDSKLASKVKASHTIQHRR